MATLEDREHAAETLAICRRRLRVREKQLRRQGDAADPSIEMEIEQLRIDIAALEPIVALEPSQDIKEILRPHVEDSIFVYTQLVKFGERLTHVEEQAQTASEQATAAAQQQQSAQTWRLGIAADVEALKTDREERKPGQRRNFKLQLLSIGLVVLGFAIVVVMLLFH